MFPSQEAISQAARANIESSLNLYTALSGKTIESIEKLWTLNLTAAKASLDESSATTRQLLAAKDPQQFIALISAQTKPTFDKAIAYNGHLANIASGVQAEFSRAAEKQFADIGRQFSQFVDEAVKNAPPGSENAVAILKTAFGNAAAGYEQFNKNARQAVHTFEANIANAASQFTPAANQNVTP
jgi:phasin family protein